MTSFYLGLAAFLAVSLNARSAWARMLGHVGGASALALLAWSIWLANDDGTFAGGGARPLLLNIMGVIAAAAALFLIAAIPAQWRRETASLAAHNTPTRFGLVSRWLHWSSAVLMLAALPMGLFVTVLPQGRADRAEFLGAHVAIGLAVVVLLVMRRLWLRQSPPPAPPSRAAAANKALLYLLLLALPVSGVVLAITIAAPLPFAVPALVSQPVLTAVQSPAATLHLALGALFAAAFALHAGAVALAHGWRRDRAAVRRMLR